MYSLTNPAQRALRRSLKEMETSTSQNGISIWAMQTFAGGCAGMVYGAMSAYLRSQPVLFMLSAYGVNSIVFTGCTLGIRNGLLYVDMFSKSPEYASALATGISGSVFTSLVSGSKQIPLSFVVWSFVGYSANYAYFMFEKWRQNKAKDILKSKVGDSFTSSNPLPTSNPAEEAMPIHHWLPFRFTGGADYTRLASLKKRLDEINELLGEK
jgi:hypothetical protein